MKSRASRVLAAGYFVLTAFAGNAAGQLKWNHLQGGLVWDVVFFDSSRGCTVEDGGRIRFTSNGGATWTYGLVHDSVRSDLFGICFAVDPQTSARTWFACGDNGVIVKSTDDGANWTIANSAIGCVDGGPVRKLQAIFMTSPSAGFVVGYDGVIRSTTNGWVNHSRPSTVPSEFACGTGDMYAIHFFKGSSSPYYQKGIVAGDYGFYMTTQDGGSSWTIGGAGGAIECPTLNERLELWGFAAADPDDYNSQWWLAGGAGTGQGFILTSSNQGSTWTQSDHYNLFDLDHAHALCGIATLYDIDRVGSTPWYFSVGYDAHVLRHLGGSFQNYEACGCPTNTDILDPPYASGNIWKQKDSLIDTIAPGGASAAYFGSGKVENDKVCLVGQFGRIVTYDESPPSGENEFKDRATKYINRLRDCAFIDDATDDTGFAVGQGWALWATTDGGVTWSEESPWSIGSLNNDATGIDISPSAQYASIVGTGDFVAKGVLSGSTWTWTQLTSASGALPSGYTGNLRAVAYVPGSGATNAYAVGDGGLVLRSTDHGQTWTTKTAPSGSPDLKGVSLLSATDGYVCGSGGTVFKTTDSGTSWAQQTINGGSSATLNDIAVWSASGGDGIAAIAVGSGGKVYEKTTASSRFNEVTAAAVAANTNELFDVEVVAGGSEIWLAGSEGTILQYSASTNQWTSIKSQTTHKLERLSFQGTGHGYAVGGSFAVVEYR
jgi:photosystem II stability/assembly factor-like uncharacterized protein